ncbi:MAG TPA: energy transducer TonB [Polyangiaceae bacterium]
MLRLTSLAGKVGAVGVSAGLHAAVLFTSLGHPATARTATDDVVELDVTRVEDAEDQAPLPVEPKGPAGAVAWHTHTHPYPVPASHDLVPHDPNLVHTFAPALLPAPTAAPAPAPEPLPAAPVLASDEGMAHFHIALGNGEDEHGTGDSASGGVHEHAQADDTPLPVSAVDGRARLVQGAAPAYPDSARADGVQGSVGLELVVGVSGGVESARVVRGVGHGLDEAALAAAHRFHFAPATRAGHAVRVRMAWSVEFRLAD